MYPKCINLHNTHQKVKKLIAKLYSFTLRSKIPDKNNRSEISLDSGLQKLICNGVKRPSLRFTVAFLHCLFTWYSTTAEWDANS